LIPEMAVAVETRSAPVAVARLKNPQPSRTVGMVWRKTSPLARQLMQISEAVCLSAETLRTQRTQDRQHAIPGPGGNSVLRNRKRQ